MMECVKEILMAHYNRYPAAQAQDMLKLLYQNEFGPGHLLLDPTKSLKWLQDEYDGLSGGPCVQPSEPIEDIGGGFARLHLAALDELGMSVADAFALFEQSAKKTGSTAGYLQKAGVLIELCEEGRLPFCPQQITQSLLDWQADGCRPFSHSEAFRMEYRPAYRVIRS